MLHGMMCLAMIMAMVERMVMVDSHRFYGSQFCVHLQRVELESNKDSPAQVHNSPTCRADQLEKLHL